jgi:hypothetical protein
MGSNDLYYYHYYHYYSLLLNYYFSITLSSNPLLPLLHYYFHYSKICSCLPVSKSDSESDLKLGQCHSDWRLLVGRCEMPAIEDHGGYYCAGCKQSWFSLCSLIYHRASPAMRGTDCEREESSRARAQKRLSLQPCYWARAQVANYPGRYKHITLHLLLHDMNSSLKLEIHSTCSFQANCSASDREYWRHC